MPLVRIDLRKGKDGAYRKEIGRVVYDALLSVGVPRNDRFQVVAEHDAENFLFDPEYRQNRDPRLDSTSDDPSGGPSPKGDSRGSGQDQSRRLAATFCMT